MTSFMGKLSECTLSKYKVDILKVYYMFTGTFMWTNLFVGTLFKPEWHIYLVYYKGLRGCSEILIIIFFYKIQINQSSVNLRTKVFKF